MAFMPWSEELALDINSIDEQHKWLVSQTNTLHDEMNKDNPNRDVVGDILEGLMEYTMNHFIMEEDLFKRHGYPEEPEHKAEHDKFTATAMELLTRFEDGETVGMEALEFLKNWLRHHIMEVDKAYAPFLKEQGVQ